MFQFLFKGVSGDPVTLKSNHFKLLTTTSWSLIQHRVDMTPEVETTKMKHQIMRDHKKHLGGYISIFIYVILDI